MWLSLIWLLAKTCAQTPTYTPTIGLAVPTSLPTSSTPSLRPTSTHVPTPVPSTGTPSNTVTPTRIPSTLQPTTPLPTSDPSTDGNFYTKDQCLCCYNSMASSSCGGSTTCYCCCGDGDDGGIESFDSCVKECEKQYKEHTCSEPSSSGFISSQEKNYIKHKLSGECDAAPRHKRLTHIALILSFSFLSTVYL